MQVQNMVWAPAILTVITAIANVPINIVLIAWHGFWGAALATSVARILQLLLLCGESSMFMSVLAHSQLLSAYLATAAFRGNFYCAVRLHRLYHRK